MECARSRLTSGCERHHSESVPTGEHAFEAHAWLRERLERPEPSSGETLGGEQRELPLVRADIDDSREVVTKRNLIVLDRSRDTPAQGSAECRRPQQCQKLAHLPQMDSFDVGDCMGLGAGGLHDSSCCHVSVRRALTLSRRVKVGFDMISAGSGFAPAAGGMAKYYEGLLEHLCHHEEVERITTFVSPWNAGLALPAHEKIDVQVCRGLSARRAGRVLYEQTALPALARRSKVDVLFSTCNVRPFAWRGPSVVVLQSMQYAFLPVATGRFRGGYLQRAVPAALRSADVVVAVTETARGDAIALYGLDPARVVAVHHGASDWTLEVMRGEKTVDPWRSPDGRPYVLAISRLYELKNHRRLIQAFARVVNKCDAPHALVVAGGDADLTAADVRKIAADQGVADRVHVLGPVPQEEVGPLYQSADAVSYVSLYETFGHPVLEALAFRKPLVTSSIGATAEVAGDAARLVDPYAVEAVAQGLTEVMLDQELRRRLAAAAPAQVAKFSWSACAEGSYRAMAQAIAGHSQAGN